MSEFGNLFTPVVLGNTLFRNRIFSAPVGLEYYPSDNVRPGDDFIAFYERKAQGGVATVSIGSAMVDNSRGAVGPTIRLDDPKALAPHFRLTSCITRHGAVADIELQHCGPNAYHSKQGLGGDIYGAYAMTNGLGMDVPEMPEDIIIETIGKYGDAAQTAKHCGYGMVTVHAGHGWLLNQFIGPGNMRRDMWGGSMENRMRIVLAIAKDIKRKCGQGFPICVRISGTEIFEGGYDIDYGVEIARLLDGHYDLINVSVGAHEEPSVFTSTHPSMFLPDGANVKYAAEVKKAVKLSKVAAVGAIAEPEFMEEVISSGHADVVMLCRQLIADPDTPAKSQMGLSKSVRKCIRCFECFSGHFTKLSNICAINPEIGFEREIRYADPVVAQKKRILVAGGGVAGMQFAVTASQRGHDVTLCEKNGILGGALRCESKVPFKQNLRRYLDQQSDNLKSAGIDVRLNTEVTPEIAREIAPDVLIAALGARPMIPSIPGADRENVMSAEYAFLHAEDIGERVIILGGGLSGMELAIYLSGIGRKVVILEMANALNFSGNVIHSAAIMNEIRRLSIEVMTSTKAVEITEDGVSGEYVGDEFSPAAQCETIRLGILQSVVTETKKHQSVSIGERLLYPADTVVYAMGQIPMREDAIKLSGCAPLFFQIGDCVEPKNIYAATSAAYTIARDIGRY